MTSNQADFQQFSACILILCLFIHGKAFCVTSLNGGVFVNVVNKFLFHQQLSWDLEKGINDQTHVPECFSQSTVTWLITPANTLRKFVKKPFIRDRQHALGI